MRILELHGISDNSDAVPYVTVGFGAASIVPGADLQPWALVERTDRRLYQAKEQGRNRIVTEDV